MRTVLCTGSRGWRDAEAIVDAFISIKRPFRVIVGDAKDGADPMFWAAAEKLHLPRHRFKARWKIGRYAGNIRNGVMVTFLEKISNRVDDGCFVLAAWDGQSTGTKDCMDRAKAAGFSVWRISGKE